MFINVRMPDGTVHRLDALEGWRVMEVIRDWGLPIKAECGGACACATCHVWVGKEWIAKLVPATEITRLRLPSSRLLFIRYSIFLAWPS